MLRNLLSVCENLEFELLDLQQVMMMKMQPNLYSEADSDFRPRIVVSIKMVVELS